MSNILPANQTPIESYFARIGYTGERKPTLAVLAALHELHPATIPFENRDPLLGRLVEITPEAIAAKLVHGRRGGYCYQHNRLLCDTLAELGFTVTPLAARVVWMAPDPEARRPLTHRFTLVTLPEGRFLADVGFGGQSPTAPLRLEPGAEQPTPHGVYRFVETEDDYRLEMKLTDRWAALYRFTLEPQGDADYELANWFSSTHPRSNFRQNLVVARIVGEDRYNLRNKTLSIHRADGSEERQSVTTAAALETLLRERYGLDLPAPIGELWPRVPDV